MKRIVMFSLMLAGVLLGGCSSGEMAKGPYLIYPGVNTEMMVLWQADRTVADGCRLEWGLTKSYGNRVVVRESTSDANGHQYQYTIGGARSLEPGTEYYYRVRGGVWAGDYHTGSFRTAPAQEATGVKFFVYGDTRSNPDIHDSVNGEMVEVYTADANYQTIVLHTGDFVANGDVEKEWREQFFGRKWAGTMELQANVAIQGVKGNHENKGELFRKYLPYPYVKKFYWSFDYGPVHVAVLDEGSGFGPDSEQYKWLEADLKGSNKKWKVLAVHAPGYSAGGAHEDANSVRKYIQPLCEKYGVDIVFAGHNHYYARCTVNGVKHVTAGSGGAPLYKPKADYICKGDSVCYVEACASTAHFCKVEIAGNKLWVQAVKPDGEVIDEFTVTK